jgi:hypothetical protein
VQASSLGLLLRRSFAHDVSVSSLAPSSPFSFLTLIILFAHADQCLVLVQDPTEKAAKKVQEGAKKVSQKRDDAKAAAKSAGQQSKSAAEKIKNQAEKEFNTARDMVLFLSHSLLHCIPCGQRSPSFVFWGVNCRF